MKRISNSIKNSLSSLRMDLWMWMGLMYTAPTPMYTPPQDELTYLFEGTDTVDSHDHNELYYLLDDHMTEHADLQHDVADLYVESYGYDHLDADLGGDIW